jgi:hypothetical protein
MKYCSKLCLRAEFNTKFDDLFFRKSHGNLPWKENTWPKVDLREENTGATTSFIIYAAD